ncbi:MAG: PEP-utilizing enzyme [bacterium]
MNKNVQDIKWNHVVTRIFALLEIWLATEVYPKFPITKDGFNLDTIVLGKNGIIERYVNQDELDQFGKLTTTGNYIELVKSFKDYEDSIIPFFDKNPIDHIEEFMKIFRQLWIHEITTFFMGLYATDPELIEFISYLRGTKSAQHIAISEFLPKLYQQISEKFGIDAELLKYALPNEIIFLKFDINELILRQKLYVIESIHGNVRLLVGDEAIKYTEEFKENFKTLEIENISEFKGSPAFQGKVSGKVIIITNENELENVNEGDILVSPMTRTSFLPAMKKAAAYITDEGGITCHAAITARELKKPCVVGTKIATKLLKNGMLVEVDATNGIIKIIK